MMPQNIPCVQIPHLSWLVKLNAIGLSISEIFIRALAVFLVGIGFAFARNAWLMITTKNACTPIQRMTLHDVESYFFTWRITLASLFVMLVMSSSCEKFSSQMRRSQCESSMCKYFGSIISGNSLCLKKDGDFCLILLLRGYKTYLTGSNSNISTGNTIFM